MEGKSDLAHIDRLKEEEELALHETREKIRQWQKFDDDYSALQSRLATLPDKVSHQIMVPFGKHAFMPGQLVHTNEIMVLLGDNWFAERSAKQACEIVDRRKKHVKKMMEDLEKQKYLLESRLGFVSDLKGAAEGRGEVVEIREEYDAEKEAKWKEERSAKKREAALAKTSPSKETQKKTTQGTKPHETVAKQADTKVSSSVESNKRTSQSQHHKDDVTKQPDASRFAPTPEELALWARLDELERQEEELDELDMSDEDDEDEDEGEEEEDEGEDEDVVTKSEERDKPQPKPHPVSTQVKKASVKHVHWKEGDDSNSSPLSLNLNQEDDDNDDDDDEEEEEEVESGSSSSVIHFSHTKVPNEKPFLEEEDTKDLSPRSPGEIYDLYAAMGKEGHNQPKSILKNPMPLQPAQRSHAPLEREKRQPLPAPRSAYTGCVVEHGPDEMDEAGGLLPTVEVERPKRVSKFKAGRQGWR